MSMWAVFVVLSWHMHKVNAQNYILPTDSPAVAVSLLLSDEEADTSESLSSAVFMRDNKKIQEESEESSSP